MNGSIRQAKFAGKFYPETKEELVHFLNFILKVETNKINTTLTKFPILGIVAPHAGYIYSGYHAVHAYQILKLANQSFDTVVVINPNHSGMGTGNYNLSCSYQWNTPLGLLVQDTEFMEALSIECFDPAHEQEHSGEVQLPFLQNFLPNSFRIVMITMNHQTHANAKILAQKLANAAKITKRKTLIVASSDFSHYEDVETGFNKDQYLIDRILQLNAEECYNQVKKHHITACGYGPVMTLIEYAKLVSDKPKMELLRRGHSGEVSFSNKVVDYASFLCYEK